LALISLILTETLGGIPFLYLSRKLKTFGGACPSSSVLEL
jgi:hypothetical protein